MANINFATGKFLAGSTRTFFSVSLRLRACKTQKAPAAARCSFRKKNICISPPGVLHLVYVHTSQCAQYKYNWISMTITEIAAQAGVSIGTVDRVLHNRGRVAPQTRERVEAVIAQCGYQPNPLARQLKRKGNFTTGVLLPMPDAGGYWQLLQSGMTEAQHMLNWFAIKLQFQYYDRCLPGSFAAAAEQLKTQFHPDAYVIAPVVPEEVLPFLSELTDTPFLFVDSPLAQTEPVATIAQNPYKAGFCAARVMYLLKGSDQYACLRMYANAYNLRERYRGFRDFFKQDQSSSVIEAVCPATKEADVCAFLDDFTARYPELSGMFVSHAEAYFVSKYLTFRGLKDRIALIGFDNLPENRSALADGSIDCIISQRPEYQGYASIYEIYRSCLLSQPSRETIDIPIDIFFKENATDFVSI